MLSSMLSLSISAICTVWLLVNTAEAQTHALPYRDDMSDLSASGFWTDFGTVTQSNIKCVGSSPCVQLYGYSELYFLHFSLAEHSTIYIGFNLCFDCDSTSPAADAEHFNVYYSCGPSQFVAPEWAVLKQYDGTLPTGTMVEGERLALPASCDNAADLNLAFISFTASSSMYMDSLLITTPTMDPSVSPSKAPSKMPSRTPSRAPTNLPSTTPTTSPTAPTAAPTMPTESPTVQTADPSTSPSRAPSKMPTNLPSGTPTTSPTTSQPTAFPSDSPSFSPTNAPLATPTKSPSKFPTISPTEPTQSPSEATPSPTEVTNAPTTVTAVPSVSPTTSEPTYDPTEVTESPITYIEHLRRIADQYNPTATREPTMAPFSISSQKTTGTPTQSANGQRQMTQSPSYTPTVSVAVKQTETETVPTAEPPVATNPVPSVITNKNQTETEIGTPSPVTVQVQYVFIREPTMAPTAGVSGYTMWVSVMVSVVVMVWTLF